MSNNNPVRPEDILADGVDHTVINGQTVRKGTMGAFLGNIEILEGSTSTEKQKQDAIQMMKELAPSLVAINLHKHAKFNNDQVEKIFIEVISQINS